MAVDALSVLYYGKTIDLQRGRFRRGLNARRVVTETAKSASPYTLHLSAFGLPVAARVPGQKHFLYCDSTWNLWASRATHMADYSQRMVEEAEKLEKKSFQTIDHIFSVSAYVRENIIEHYGIDPAKITVVGTGLGIIQPYFGPKDYTNGQILFVAKGRFADKGGPLVLEAFQRAQQQNPNLKLTIVGQKEYPAAFDLPNLTTYGFVEIEKLQSLFETHSLFLMPALNEPWGLVYLEALACQMPIVGLDRNSFPEISGNGLYGIALKDTDPAALAELLLKCFASPEMLKSMGRAGQEYVLEKYSWEKTVDVILGKIVEIC